MKEKEEERERKRSRKEKKRKNMGEIGLEQTGGAWVCADPNRDECQDPTEF